jgi:glycosyltransferase involved in cell wall biosynthesis
MNDKTLIILGVRGIPATHGGFETFVEHLSLYLIAKGWRVTVYCQEIGSGVTYASEWNGIKRIHIPVKSRGPMGTIVFDLYSIAHSIQFSALFLTLGYNTAFFNVLHRLAGKFNIINMDGIEWRRQKWGGLAKTWFWLNERAGCWFGNHLVADHPEIANHLSFRVSRRKITMIPYGGREVHCADMGVLKEYGLVGEKYAIVIARAEPENSILEVVSAFSSKVRNAKLIVLGAYHPATHKYHREILNAASNEVVFVGAVYDAQKIDALRFFSRVYIHGHQVGGTNPSLVEAIAAGNAILAHDNKFNRWVAKDCARYFDSTRSFCGAIDQLMSDDNLIKALQSESKRNYDKNFRWSNILAQYERLLEEKLEYCT